MYVAKVCAAVEDVLLVLKLAGAHDLALRMPLLERVRVVGELIQSQAGKQSRLKASTQTHL